MHLGIGPQKFCPGGRYHILNIGDSRMETLATSIDRRVPSLQEEPMKSEVFLLGTKSLVLIKNTSIILASLTTSSATTFSRRQRRSTKTWS